MVHRTPLARQHWAHRPCLHPFAIRVRVQVLASPSRNKKASTSTRANSEFVFDPHMSYADLEPLDGEEGELIDDEACDMGSDGATLQTGMGMSFSLFEVRSAAVFTRPLCL